MNQKRGEAYHHQGFSTTGYILPMLRGLAGLEVDGLRGAVTLNPRFPANWETVELANVAVGSRRYDFTITRSEGAYSVAVTPAGASAGTEPVEVTFSPGLEPGIRAEAAMLNGNPVSGFSVAVRPSVTAVMRGGDLLTIRHGRGPAILPSDPPVDPGGVNTGIKIVSLREERSDMKTLRLTVEGLAGRAYDLDLMRSEQIASVNGGTLENGKLRIAFDGKGKSGFVRKEVTLRLKQ